MGFGGRANPVSVPDALAGSGFAPGAPLSLHRFGTLMFAILVRSCRSTSKTFTHVLARPFEAVLPEDPAERSAAKANGVRDLAVAETRVPEPRNHAQDIFAEETRATAGVRHGRLRAFATLRSKPLRIHLTNRRFRNLFYAAACAGSWTFRDESSRQRYRSLEAVPSRFPLPLLRGWTQLRSCRRRIATVASSIARTTATEQRVVRAPHTPLSWESQSLGTCPGPRQIMEDSVIATK